MEKIKITLLAVLIILATVLTLGACDFILPDSDKDSINVDEYFTFTYLEDSDSYEIKCKNTALSGEILIPETYNGKPVTSISDEAFVECIKITKVVIPESVISIGDKAFYDCDGLTSVVIPDSVTYISVRAFNCCFGLTSIEVSENNQYYKSIDGNLYSKNGKTLIRYAAGKNTPSFEIPNSVTTIGDYAFYHCFDLTSIIIPDGVEIIGMEAFSDCDDLANLIIPDSVKSIGMSAFSSCEILTSIVIPDSVTSIGDGAFYHCANLEYVVIGDRVASIGDGAFAHCYSLADVYYTGSEDEWNIIDISESNNSYLVDATIHYNYTPEK